MSDTSLLDAPLCRSLLVTSALRVDRFRKGRASGADVNLIDLEDAVPTNEKARARRAYLQLTSEDLPEVLGVRINSLMTRDGLEDLLAVCDAEIEPVVIHIPKAETAEQIELADRILTAAGRASTVWAVIETSNGVANARAIVSSSPRLSGLVFGLADYAAEIGASLAWESVLFARSQVVMAARAAGIQVMDAPTFDLDDVGLLRTEARRSVDMGYTGKVAVHPRQVPIINEIYSPTAEAVTWAQQVVKKFDASSKGIHTVDGLMVGPPFLKRAQAILELQGMM
ncbi:hypothetical protein SD37_10615 [Amycolatopsis orientalis]|uniref:HpcH/HpaI aldolase/citrate lyase domain-containing protein n=1 Tax=Amycolatopsis orientalis TaxID=31958 RepID=A0A193BV44_AMYOR|nr:hypothetical protein SD37_10615 [Amycolatopsis orientalis]